MWLLVCWCAAVLQVALASSSGNSRDKSDEATLQNWWNLRLRGEQDSQQGGCRARYKNTAVPNHDHDELSFQASLQSEVLQRAMLCCCAQVPSYAAPRPAP